MILLLTSEKRKRLIQARVATGSPKQIEYLELDTRRRLKSGYLTQEIHDFVLSEIAKKETEK